jgi:hypothetical protein
MFETLARDTGGAVFNSSDRRKNGAGQPGPVISSEKTFALHTIYAAFATDGASSP